MKDWINIKDTPFYDPDAGSKQAEVTNDPQLLIKDLQDEISSLEERMKFLEDQNEKYEKALWFYANESNYYCVDYDNKWAEVLTDNGKIAREALRG